MPLLILLDILSMGWIVCILRILLKYSYILPTKVSLFIRSFILFIFFLMSERGTIIVNAIINQLTMKHSIDNKDHGDYQCFSGIKDKKYKPHLFVTI